LSYILTYKFSQGHPETFFSPVRANNNTSSSKFQGIFKRFWVHQETRVFSGNATPQDYTIEEDEFRKVEAIISNISDFREHVFSNKAGYVS